MKKLSVKEVEPKEVSECPGAGNRHPDSSEMYCSKCGSNTPPEKNEHLHEPTPTINTTRNSSEKLINTKGKQQLTPETNEAPMRVIPKYSRLGKNKNGDSQAKSHGTNLPKTNEADLKEFDEY